MHSPRLPFAHQLPPEPSRGHSVVRTRGARGWVKALTVLALGLVTGLVSLDVAAAPRTHVVSSGQRLGSIAKRYGVSIEELCRANGITRRTTIRPGQRLIIPGTEAETTKSSASADKPLASAAKTEESNDKVAAAPPAPVPLRPVARADKAAPRAAAPRTHVVASGQTLGGIARRYQVSIDALCRASGITRRTKLRVGQRLVVPNVGDETGEQAATFRTTGRIDHAQLSRSGGRISYKNYARTPSRRGYLTLVRYDRTWSGQVAGKLSGKLLPKARATVSSLLGADESGPQMDARLLLLLVKVSDHFGGRPVRVVSGLRENSYFHDSKHPLGRAMDFSIPGVPNEVVRDYCRTLGSVGVGYYPNSSFVHLDVRERATYWVDYAGPGEAPRSTPWRVAARPVAPPLDVMVSSDASAAEGSAPAAPLSGAGGAGGAPAVSAPSLEAKAAPSAAPVPPPPAPSTGVTEPAPAKPVEAPRVPAAAQ